MPSAKNLNARRCRQPIRRPKQFLSEKKSTCSSPSVRREPDADFIREILCGVIEQAVKDLKNESTYKSYSKNMEVSEDRRTAKDFLRSRFFRELCSVLHLPADKILKAALV